MLVVDASVLAPALADDGPDGDLARDRLSGEALAAPELIDIEVLSVVRGAIRRGDIDVRRAALAVDDLRDLPLARARHGRLLTRCLELRDNLTAYDAAYVALAEALSCALLTADGGLAAAPGVRCEIELLAG